MQDGAYIVLAGISNAGKSSLYNALIGRNRAIVDDKPGTTRDFLESTFELFGIPIVLIDTAGLRYDRDVSNVEGKGIKISREKIEQADCVILVLDGQQVQKNNYELDDLSKQILEKKSETPVLTVWNKIDIAKCENIPKLCDEKFFCFGSFLYICRQFTNLNKQEQYNEPIQNPSKSCQNSVHLLAWVLNVK